MRDRELARRANEAHLVGRLGDRFVLERSIVHLSPIEHILAGFSFETIYEAQYVRVVAFAMPLAPPNDIIAYPIGVDVWEGDIHQASGLPVDLLEAMKERVPFLVRHSDPRRFIRSRQRSRNYGRAEEEEAYLYLASGELRYARTRLKHLSYGRSSRFHLRLAAKVLDDVLPVSAAARDRAREMLVKLDASEAAACAQLRSWQDQTLAAVRLTRGG
jgi:hypothetical protein